MSRRVGIYLRLSDAKKERQSGTDEVESIENQRKILMDYCKEKGWDIYKIYSDESSSGADDNRREWQDLLNDCEKGLINTVLCKTLSRFSRNMSKVEEYLNNRFLELGVQFLSLTDYVDNQNPDTRKLIQLNSLVNQWYLEDLSENIHNTLQTIYRDGKCNNSVPPYGYLLDTENKRLIPDPKTAPIVQHIFELYSAGNGYCKIAQSLNSDGIPSPTEYKKTMCGFKNPRKPPNGKYYWEMSGISRILHNEVYIGNLVQGKTRIVDYKTRKKCAVPEDEWVRVEKTHEAVIPQELWEDVQQRLFEKERIYRPRSSKNGFASQNLFAGKVYCGCCGRVMTLYNCPSPTGKVHRYLRCTSRFNGQPCSCKHNLEYSALSKLVLQQFQELVRMYAVPEKIDIPEECKATTQIHELEQKCFTLTKAVESDKAIMAKLYTDKLMGNLAADMYERLNQRYLARIKKASEELTQITVQLERLKGKPRIRSDEELALEKYTLTTALTRDIVEQFIEAVIYDSNLSVDQPEIRIDWRV